MGVDNIITFDAHDPRVQNAIPLHGFETVQPAYQFIKNLLRDQKDLQIDSDHMMVISPDEGGMGRAIYIANVLGLDMGMFYKRRDYTRVVNGRNPIVAHEFLGSDVDGKDVIVIDDMISSGAVSYTHLSRLSKNQIPSSGSSSAASYLSRIILWIFSLVAWLIGCAMSPVSYTHLSLPRLLLPYCKRKFQMIFMT